MVAKGGTMSSQKSTVNFRRDIFFILAAVLIGWYLALCLTHFFSDRPLWNDEQCVFASIEAFSAKDMFSRKLLSLQVFPRVYLFLIQRFSRLFDYSLQALRFFPLVSMLGAFFIWLRLARRELPDRLAYLTFVLSWPASALLIYYSAELKPYSMDMLAGALILLFIFHQKKVAGIWPRGRYLTVLCLLPALGLFSYPAFLFALIVWHNLLLDFRRKRNPRDFYFYSLAFLFFAAISYWFDMRFRHFMEVTAGFGDYFISFASAEDFFKTWQEGTVNLFVKWLVIRPRIFKYLATFFMIFGLVEMFAGFFRNIRKDKYYFVSLQTIPFVLYVELFILGALKKYPFTVPRLSLFFCPLVLLMTIRGITAVKHWNRPLGIGLHGLYAVFLGLLVIGLTLFSFQHHFCFEPVIFTTT